jgi:dihydrodipicolinate synthase/N-acetylneuraminate lyase
VKTSAVSPADLAASVISVPPLARHADLSFNREANATLIRHLESGGIRSLLYGGNANFYNIPFSEYASTLEALAELAGPDTWVIPSVGPDYGKMMDQAAVIRGTPFPTAMALPLGFPATPDGIATGLRRFAEACGKPVLVYIKSDNYLSPELVGKLVGDGLVSAIKYAWVLKDQTQDPFLRGILEKVPANLIVSGIGERPAIIHLKEFGLQGFTSGSVCVGPRGSQKLLRAIQAKEWDLAARLREAYLPLEDCRDSISPIRTLHEAVTLSGVANMGPILPLLSNIEPLLQPRVKAAALALLAHDRALA